MCAEPRVSSAGFLERGAGKRVDRAPLRAVAAAALERARRHLRRGPQAAPAPGLILGDRALERIGTERLPPCTRQRDERGELGEDFPAGWRHDERDESMRE